MTKLFIVGFPRDMQEIELVESFSAYGQVSTITIVTDKETGKSKGYGFITMTDEAGAKRAIEAMNGATIGDRQISVRTAEDKSAPALGRYNTTKPSFHTTNYNKVEKSITPLKNKRPRRPL